VTGETSAVTVVSRLKKVFTQSDLSLAQSASRFDREQSGQISAPSLACVLQFLTFKHSQQDLAAIREAYRGSVRGIVDWKVLCPVVDPERRSIDDVREAVRLYCLVANGGVADASFALCEIYRRGAGASTVD
jgi:Ca2+-binding EF-hand superfamily protein